MKRKNLILPVLLCTLTSLAATSCKSKVEVGGESTIQIKAYKGGYGTDWLHAAADEFQKANPDVKFDFVEESSGVTEAAGQEIMVPKNNQIDLYFLTGIDMYDCIERSQTILRTKDKTILEPLNDILDSKAIDKDGKEESETIRSRMFDGYIESSSYNGDLVKWQDNVYKLPWADATTGLFCNPSVLARYGLEKPLTTDELVNCVTTIASHTAADKVYPYSWAGQNAPGYWSYLFETWFAQYSGKKAFDNFMKCDAGDGDIKRNGYKVYQDQGILKGLEAMYQILDLKYSSNGSASKSHMEAQNEFITGKSAFMVDGDWLLCEMSRDYFDQAKDIEMVRTPILSSIGTELGITDAQLHTLVEMIDEGKSNDEIGVALTMLTSTQIERVRAARSVHDGIGVGHDIVIPSYSDAKDAAKRFVRFLYSNDGCRIFRNKAYANMPLSYTPDAADANTNFQQSVDKLYSYEKPAMVSGSVKLNNIRSAAQIFMFNYTAWVHPNTYKSIMIDKNGDKKLSAQYIFEKEAEYVEKSWSKYMTYVD
ncbi:MAG: extracellular solute-binding protein [Bacilli bacterium]|nr:extracellular solute-binding protein [Bacilli bacterium]